MSSIWIKENLEQMMSPWESFKVQLENVEMKLIESVQDCIDIVHSHEELEDEENRKERIKTLDQAAKDVVVLQEELKIIQNILRQMKIKWAESRYDATKDPQEIFNLFEEIFAEWSDRHRGTCRDKFTKKNAFYKEYAAQKWEALHPDERLPDNFLDLGGEVFEDNDSRQERNDDEDNEEDDVTMQHEKESLVDPLTQQIYRDPVYSQSCKHNYSRQEIEKMISDSPQRTIMCPIVGCQRSLTSNLLIPNRRLSRMIQRSERAQI